MANIEPRVNKDGVITGYRVRWRKGGTATGRREGEKFDDLTAAEEFEAAVNRAGQEWPWGYVPGVGWDAPAYAALIASAGTDATDAPQGVTFAEFADKWVDRRAKAQPRTRADYRRDIKAHMNPTFGEADIGDEAAISEETVGDWVVRLLDGDGDQPLAPSTVIRLHAILFSILKAAVRAKRRSGNPCEYTELPPRDGGSAEEEMVFLTRQEFHVLLAAAKDDVRDLLTVLVNTGLRWSELTALQVRDVHDLLGPKPYLRIRRAWKRQPDNTFALGPPKSRRSRRNVSVNKAIALILVGLIANKKQTDFLFTTVSTGVVWRHNLFFDTRWRPAVYKAIRCQAHRDEDGVKGANYGGLRAGDLKTCGCPGVLEKVPRIHDMRHTHAAWLIADGAQLTAIQRRLGHQGIQTTSDRYGHLMPEVDDAIVAALDAKWEASLPGADIETARATASAGQ
jgi:integrase